MFERFDNGQQLMWYVDVIKLLWYGGQENDIRYNVR